MKKRHLMTMLMCSVCLAAAVPAAVFAEKDETEVSTEAAEVSAETEEETEGMAERPDYTAADYVTLGEYKGLEVTVDLTASEEEVQEELDYRIQQADVGEELTEGTVQDGDTACIDFEGKMDGEAFDGGTSKDYDLEIGSGTFIEGFEEGLIGAAIGDTVDIPLTFPESYFSSDLAGKDVVFTVTVHSVTRMPQLTDDLVNTVTEGEYTDVASYRAYIRSYLEENKAGQRDTTVKTELLTQIINKSKVQDYPQAMVDYQMDALTDTYKEYAEHYELEFAEFLSAYLGLSEDEFYEQAKLVVQQNMQQELYLKAIAEAEGIEISEEEYETGCQTYADMYGFQSAEDLLAVVAEGDVRISLLQDKVLDFLVENAVVEEITETETETEAQTEA